MSKNSRCPIWGTPAAEDHSNGRDGVYVDSQRAGGRYFISRRAVMLVGQSDALLRARLTYWLIEQRRLGVECPEIYDSTITMAEQRDDSPVHVRGDRLLQFIGDRTATIGSRVSFQKSNATTLLALAWSESTEYQEMGFLLSYLEQRGWIEKGESAMSMLTYILTVDGYSRLADLKTTTTDSSQGFVAMWFDANMENAWEYGIKPGIEDAGYKAIRIDQKEHLNKIDDEIIAEIRRSRFVVADFTQGNDGARGGVYYEAGFAHGLGIPVIFSCQADVLDKVHFDTRQYNHLVWKEPRDFRQSLNARISAVIGDGPYKEEPKP